MDAFASLVDVLDVLRLPWHGLGIWHGLGKTRASTWRLSWRWSTPPGALGETHRDADRCPREAKVSEDLR